VGLGKSLANEFGKDGIPVNNVGTGFTATDRPERVSQNPRRGFEKNRRNEVPNQHDYYAGVVDTGATVIFALRSWVSLGGC
jgi:NAD(P)-dependent dehydrogenase (short-subunit alcohol dehydrogenase family)